MKDFFISYTDADHEWAEWIAWQLELSSYSTELQAWDFLPGSNFILKMHQANKETCRTIAVYSPEYFKSLMTQPEWAAILIKDPMGTENRLIPVRVRDCKPDGLLSAISYIDLVGLLEKDAKNILLKGISQKRLKPSNPPKFPGQTSGKSTPNFPGTQHRNHSSIIRETERKSSHQLVSIPCAYCEGTGKDNPFLSTVCRVCNGIGENEIKFSDSLEIVPCAYCEGTGKDNPLLSAVCRVCNGIGANLVKKPTKKCRYCKGNGKDIPGLSTVCRVCNGIGYN
jgi:hypothetical protein